MENTNNKGSANHDFVRPFIRTMEDDLKKIKSSPIKNNTSVSDVSFASKPASAPALRPTPAPAPIFKQASASIPIPVSKPIPLSTPIFKPTPVPAVYQKPPTSELDAEKAEQAKREKEAAEKARIDEEDRFRKEKEKLIQIEAAQKLEIAKKREEALRVETEKAEQAKREKEAAEKAGLIEEERIKKEKEILVQAEAAKKSGILKKKEGALKTVAEKAEQARKEKEAAEKARIAEEMMAKKKLSEEIKKEMEGEIEKEKEKSDKIKRDMAMEIKKEMEAAEALKRERESALKKRVAKVIKEEMDAEIEKEKEKAERVKKEVEMEIKEETEKDIEEEKEFEEDIKRKMAIDIRQVLAERVAGDNKSAGIQIKKEEDIPLGLKTNYSSKAARSAFKAVNVPKNLPISQTVAGDDQRPDKTEIDKENERTEQISKEKKLEIIKKRNEDLRKETEEKERLAILEAEKQLEIAKKREEALRAEAKKAEQAGKEKEAAEKARLIEEERMRAIPDLKPADPEPSGEYFGKMQSREKLINETGKLSPAERLVRQSFSDIFNGKMTNKNNSASPISLVQNKSISAGENVKENNSGFFSKSSVKLSFAFLIVVVGISAGVYYLYNNSKKPIITPTPSVTPADVPVADFISGATEASINTDLNADLVSKIKLYFFNTMPSGIYRLIIKDNNGQNGLALEDLGKNLNIIFPGSIANTLEKDYNLMVFNYPEKSYLRLALALKIKSSSDIASFAKNWENSMYQDLKPMFLGNFGTYEDGKQFGSNAYNGFDIRYLPLGAENIGLNYAIDNERKFLLIATSKDDIFNLIDKIIKGN